MTTGRLPPPTRRSAYRIRAKDLIQTAGLSAQSSRLHARGRTLRPGNLPLKRNFLLADDVLLSRAVRAGIR